MRSVTTEEFPYTLRYVTELLGVDEQTVRSAMESISLAPREDGSTGRIVFSYSDIEAIRQVLVASQMRQQSEASQPNGDGSSYSQPRTSPLQSPHQPLSHPMEPPQGVQPIDPPVVIDAPAPGYEPETPSSPPLVRANETKVKPQAVSRNAEFPVQSASSENLAVIIETVSHAKEGILRDMSRLLDDKLSGLDEVVVELIRCKSENDALRNKLKAALDDKQALEDEVNRFKPVQFGFYRKV